MASESFDGGDPATRSENGATPDTDEDTGTAFERFEQLARKLVNTPKSVVEKGLEQAKREKRAAPAP